MQQNKTPHHYLSHHPTDKAEEENIYFPFKNDDDKALSLRNIDKTPGIKSSFQAIYR